MFLVFVIVSLAYLHKIIFFKNFNLEKIQLSYFLPASLLLLSNKRIINKFKKSVLPNTTFKFPTPILLHIDILYINNHL